METNTMPLYFAIHPAWSGEMSRISAMPESAIRREFIHTFSRGALFLDEEPKAFNENRVLQISEKEYYSFSDGLMYRMSNEGKRIALIPLKGALYAGYSWSMYEALAEMVKSAEHEAYAGALILADSPGGMVKKMDQLEKAISGYSKNIGVLVSGNLNSAAAYVTAGADWIAGEKDNDKLSFGSIGVYAMAENISEYNEKNGIKVAVIRSEGADDKMKPNRYEPWEENALDKIQEAVNRDAAKFLAVMQEKRKIAGDSLEEVKRGGEHDLENAVRLGLADGSLDLDEAVEKVATNQLFV